MQDTIKSLDSDIYDRFTNITKKWFSLNNNELNDLLSYIEDRETYNKMIRFANKRNKYDIDNLDDLIYKAT
jgi:RNA processing factor Prp31